MMNAGLNHSSPDADQIVHQMQLARSAGREQIAELHVEAKRLLDWKEYVRSMPILTVAAASLFGYGVVRNAALVFQRTNSPALNVDNAISSTKTLQSTLTASLSTLAMSILSNAVRSYLRKLTQSRNLDGD
jgi:hypothetical protein